MRRLDVKGFRIGPRSVGHIVAFWFLAGGVEAFVVENIGLGLGWVDLEISLESVKISGG